MTWWLLTTDLVLVWLWTYSQQGDVDHLLLNLRVDATMVKEQMHIRWAGETGLVDAIEPIVASYKEVRGLQVRIFCLLFSMFPSSVLTVGWTAGRTFVL